MESVAKVFGKRVRTLRKAKGWTQEELAKASHLDAKHVGAIERGTKTSSFYAVQRLAEALGTDYFQLFLPETHQTAEIQQQISRMTTDPALIDPAHIQEFLRGLRAALRKLEAVKPL